MLIIISVVVIIVIIIIIIIIIIITIIVIIIKLIPLIRKCEWFNAYRSRKWNWWQEFNPKQGYILLLANSPGKDMNPTPFLLPHHPSTIPDTTLTIQQNQRS